MKRNSHNFSFFPITLIFWVVISFLLTSCEPTPVDFTREDRKLIDSLFQKERPAINKEVDSLCKVWAQKNTKEYKDSLLAKRWAEIEQILKSEE